MVAAYATSEDYGFAWPGMKPNPDKYLDWFLPTWTYEPKPKKSVAVDLALVEDTSWIGVDLDGTLAHYEGWKGPGEIGEPIPEMVERVKRWLDDGKKVKIFTARGTEPDPVAVLTARLAIERWCLKHLGEKLEVTASKDLNMIELWDDRAVQVMHNEGVPVPGQTSRVDGLLGFGYPDGGEIN